MSWEKVRLGEVASFGRVTVEPRDIEAGTLYVGLENMTSSGQFDGVGSVVTGELGSSKFAFSAGCVLYGKLRPYLRKTAIPDFEGVCSTDILPILPDSKRLNASYLKHFLRMDEMVNLAVARCAGANLPRLSPKVLLDFEIPLPPLPTQQRIAAVLDEADALRQKRENAIKKWEASKARYIENFISEFQNDLVTLSDLIDAGPNNGLYRPSSDYGSGTPIIRIDAFYDGVVTGIKSLKRVNIPDDVKQRFKARPRSILINRVNSREYLGKSAIVPNHDEELVFESNMMRFEVNEDKIIPEYLIECMQLSGFKRQVLQRCKDAVNQSSINQQDVKSFAIPLPPLEQQRQLARTVREFNQILSLLRHQLTLTSNLLASLQTRAFSGELALRDLEALL